MRSITGNDDVQARFKGVGVSPEALYRPLIPLRHHLEAHEEQDERQGDKEQEQL
jgi:hypothetical protein